MRENLYAGSASWVGVLWHEDWKWYFVAGGEEREGERMGLGVVQVELVLESREGMGWLHVESVESWFSIASIVDD